MTENIFNSNITADELSELEHDYTGRNETAYLADLIYRAKQANTHPDFERISDLQELARLRGDDEGVKRLDEEMKAQYGEIYARLFDE